MENLELICGIHDFSKEKTQRKIHELSHQFDLTDILKRKAGKLSGGWQRRVSIAMALISEPQILFLDEPTLGLDVLARHELWETIRSSKGKVTIILPTHYMEEAASLSDRIAIMKNGKLLATGTVEELNQKAGVKDFETAFVSIVSRSGSAIWKKFFPRTLYESTNLLLPTNIVFYAFTHPLVAVWMPYFNVVIKNTFPDVVLQKFEGGMKAHERQSSGFYRMWNEYHISD